VPSTLIKRSKQHFHTLPCGVDVILGNNGYIWMCESKTSPEADSSVEPIVQRPTVSRQVRECICRVRNSIVALSKMFIAIHVTTVMDVYEKSISLGLEAKEVVYEENVQRVTQSALEYRVL
jgi:exosome complex component RRP4